VLVRPTDGLHITIELDHWRYLCRKQHIAIKLEITSFGDLNSKARISSQISKWHSPSQLVADTRDETFTLPLQPAHHFIHHHTSRPISPPPHERARSQAQRTLQHPLASASPKLLTLTPKQPTHIPNYNTTSPIQLRKSTTRHAPPIGIQRLPSRMAVLEPHQLAPASSSTSSSPRTATVGVPNSSRRLAASYAILPRRRAVSPRAQLLKHKCLSHAQHGAMHKPAA
jgi:hypothetical protein